MKVVISVFPDYLLKMLLWPYSYLTYNLYNEYWGDEHEILGYHSISR